MALLKKICITIIIIIIIIIIILRAGSLWPQAGNPSVAVWDLVMFLLLLLFFHYVAHQSIRKSLDLRET